MSNKKGNLCSLCSPSFEAGKLNLFSFELAAPVAGARLRKAGFNLGLIVDLERDRLRRLATALAAVGCFRIPVSAFRAGIGYCGCFD